MDSCECGNEPPCSILFWAKDLPAPLYLVFYAFISRPVFLLAANRAAIFFFVVCMLLPVTLHLQHRSEADVYHEISDPPCLLDTNDSLKQS